MRGGGGDEGDGFGIEGVDYYDTDEEETYTPPQARTATVLRARNSRNAPDFSLAHRGSGPCSFVGAVPVDTSSRIFSPPLYPGSFQGGDPYSRPTTCLPFINATAAVPGRQRKRYVSDASFVLVPSITITPDRKSVDDSGTRCFWAAVQVGTQLRRPDKPAAALNGCTVSIGGVAREIHDEELAGLHEFGYLYDINLEIYPTSGSSVLEILVDNSPPSILTPGTKMLSLAHVQLEPTTSMTSGAALHGNGTTTATESPAAVVRGRRSARQSSSDELMQDLELQLGSTRTEYLRVRLTYRHSAFPHQPGPGTGPTGKENPATATTTTTVMTHSMEMEATATIERRNASSLWSPAPPPPAQALVSQHSPLLQIVAACWGMSAAEDVMQRISQSSSSCWRPPRTVATAMPPHNNNKHTGLPTRAQPETPLSPSPRLLLPKTKPETASPKATAGSSPTSPTMTALRHRRNPLKLTGLPQVPARRASLQRKDLNICASAGSFGSISSTAAGTSPAADPAQEIWSNIRMASSSTLSTTSSSLQQQQQSNIAPATTTEKPMAGFVAGRVEDLQQQQQHQQQQQTQLNQPPQKKKHLHQPQPQPFFAPSSRSSAAATSARRSDSDRRGGGVHTSRRESPATTSSLGLLGGGKPSTVEQARGLRGGGGGAKAKRESGRWGWGGWW